jgi:hypothetical protein
MAAIARSGAKYYHLQLSHTTNVEAAYDPIFEAAWKNGVTILPVLYAGGPTGQRFPYVETLEAEGSGPGSWIYFVYEVVHRYGFKGSFWKDKANPKPVPAWEIWNEPNFAENNPGGQFVQPREYTRFARRISIAIQDAQEQNVGIGSGYHTRVNFGNLFSAANKQFGEGLYSSMNVRTFLLEADAVDNDLAHFSGLALHPYSFTTLKGLEDNMTFARHALNDIDDPGDGNPGTEMEIWITELGWLAEGGDTAHPAVGPEGQKKLLTEGFNYIRNVQAGYNIQSLIYYNYRDFDTAGGGDWGDRAGLRTKEGDFRPAWYAFEEQTGVPLWPTVTKNIPSILMNRAGSGKSEVHTLKAGSYYSSFLSQLPTALSETTASQWQFSFADYNNDGVQDLIGVLMNGTGSGKTEVHILSGASNYQTFLLHAVTGLGETTASQWRFVFGYYNADNKPDMIGVLMNGPTGTGKTEVHVFNGSENSNYSEAIIRNGTALWETKPSQWQFAVGDYNRDGRSDLIGVLMNGPTGTGKTEIHILNGATNYTTGLLSVGTALGETRPQQWQFSAADYDADGIPDLLGMLMNGPTGTGKTEAHILNGASNYSSFLVETGTALGETTASQWQFAGGHVSGSWLPTATTEAATAIGTEAATLNGVVNPQGLTTTYHFEYGPTTSYGSSTPESGSLGNGISNVAVSRAIGGLSQGTTYHFRVVAKNLEGTTYGSDRTFKTAVTGTSGQLGGMAITEPFNGSSSSLANFNANWSPLGWASGVSPKGEDTTAGWRPLDAHPTVNGAFYEPTITDTGSGIAAVATMATNPSNVGRHFSVWLDMPNPSSVTRAGYELRFTNVSSGLYNVTLSRWQSGTETVLASKSSYGFANENSLALVDQGGTVSAWTNTGSGFSQLLSAGDASYGSGSAGVQGAGNITRLTNFKAGALLTPVANMDAALKALPVNAAFSINENPLSGSGSWGALAWDNSTSGHNTGWVSGGWGPYDAYPTINGAYWQKTSFADSGAGDAVAALLYGNPTIASRYFSLWLNAPTPGSARSGYELRFTETSMNIYEVALSRWQSGTRTVLASKLGYSFPVGSQFALVDKGGTVSGWAKISSEYTQLLSAADSTYISGYTGIEGSGNILRLKDFRSGPLAPF